MLKLNEGLHEYTYSLPEGNIYFKCDYKKESGEIIVFLHGLGCSSDIYRNIYDKDYFPGKSLLFIDFLGFGKSDKPENFSYTMQAQADTIEKLLNDLPNISIHIAAHSMGGAIALLLSENFFKRVISFANMEGNLIDSDCGILSRGIANSDYDEYKNIIFPKQKLEFENHVQLRFNESNANAIYKSSKSLVKYSDSGELLAKFKSLACKKCYFWGQGNFAMPVRKQLKPIPEIMVPKSGHGMMNDNPDSFYTLLSGFIAG